MRPMGNPLRCERKACLVYQRAYAFVVVDLSRYQYFQLIGKPDQAAIEHPMSRAGKCDSIIYGIGTICFDWSNVGRINFRSPTAIDQFEPSHCTPAVICIKDNTAKGSISDDS